MHLSRNIPEMKCIASLLGLVEYCVKEGHGRCPYYLKGSLCIHCRDINAADYEKGR